MMKCALAWLLVALSSLLGAGPPVREVTLKGAPAEVGRQWALVNGAAIKKDVAVLLGQKALEERDLLKRARQYSESVDQRAPHWVAEVKAIAETVGFSADVLKAYFGAKYRDVNLLDCFTYMFTPDQTADGKTLFHKNRDNRYRPQSAYLKRMVTKDDKTYKYLAIGDTSDLGVMMMVNEQGLAGAADVGPPDAKPVWKGWMNPDILRVIAERAADCGEALKIVQEFTDRKLYAGGKNSTVYLFADRHGRGLRVVSYSDHLTYDFHDEGMLLSALPKAGWVVRKEAAARSELDAYRRPVDVAFMNRVSRVGDVSAPSNIASMTVEIPKVRPDLFTCAWISLGHARNAVYVPIFFGADATPLPLVDGSLSELNQSLQGKKDLPKTIDILERELFETSRKTETVAQTLLREKDAAAVVAYLEKANRTAVERVMMALSNVRQ